MADNKVEVRIDINGNAVESLDRIQEESKKTESAFDKLGNTMVRLNAIMDVAGRVIGAVSGAMKACTEAHNKQAEVETKLQRVMLNTMDAYQADIDEIKELTAVQQQLGIVGDEVQLAGAQELATYLSKTDSLKDLIPVMNDMVAQQYGYNATQESAVQIATMMGKVMDGQVGALSRYGYKFDEAQEKILKFGTEEERAAVLAEVVGASVGGMNEALAQTPEGHLKQLQNRFGDLQEQLGGMWTDLKFALEPFMDSLMYVAEWLMPKLHAGVLLVTEKIEAWYYSVEPFITETLGCLEELWESVFSSLGEIGGKIGELSVFVQPVVDVFKNHVLPAVKNIYQKMAQIVTSVIDFVAKCQILRDVFDVICWAVGRLVDSLSGFFDTLAWLWDNVLKPILNGIDQIYQGLKKMFSDLLEWIMKPIRALLSFWNKIRGKSETVVEQKITGEDSLFDKMQDVVAGGDNLTTGNGLGEKTGKSTEAVATGGTRSTTVNISIGDMIGKCVFNGSTGENVERISENFAEALSRALGMAAVAV